MAIDTLKKLFTRDLTKLRSEIAAYQTESNIWRTDGNIANAAGNLCLHLVGNLVLRTMHQSRKGTALGYNPSSWLAREVLVL